MGGLEMNSVLSERLDKLLRFRQEEPEVAAMMDLNWGQIQAAYERASTLLDRRKPNGKPDKAAQRMASDVFALIDYVLQEAHALEQGDSNQQERDAS